MLGDEMLGKSGAPVEPGSTPSGVPLPADLIDRAALKPILAEQRIFFGWVVVACAFSILCIAYGIQFSFGVFMPFISADTVWDRGSLSLPYSVYVFVYSALGVVSGRLTDRLGPRIVLTVGGCLLGTGVMLMSPGHTLWAVCI